MKAIQLVGRTRSSIEFFFLGGSILGFIFVVFLGYLMQPIESAVEGIFLSLLGATTITGTTRAAIRLIKNESVSLIISEEVIEISDIPDFTRYSKSVPTSNVARFVHSAEDRTYFELSDGGRLFLSPQLANQAADIMRALNEIAPNITVVRS